MGDTPENYFEKINSVKQKLSSAIQGMNDKQIRNILCHCSYYKAGRRNNLNEKEREVYDLLLRNKLSPKTTYQWFCLTNAPDHIKDKIRKREISYEDAQSKSYAWRRMIGMKNGKEIMEEMKTIIGGLEWKNTNHTINSF